MGSLSHYAYGAVYQWMVENIGGIRSDGVGYHKLIIAPQPGGTLTSAWTSYRSIHGRVATDWRIEADRFTLNVTIPANTTATVILPTHDAAKVRESGKLLARAEGIKLAGLKEGRVAIEAGSGRYAFTITGPVQPEGRR
jgi:alpha-L-rhamnosidase